MKKILCLVLTVVLVLSAAACSGGGGGKDSKGSNAGKSEQVDDNASYTIFMKISELLYNHLMYYNNAHYDDPNSFATKDNLIKDGIIEKWPDDEPKGAKYWIGDGSEEFSPGKEGSGKINKLYGVWKDSKGRVITCEDGWYLVDGKKIGS